VGSSRLAQPRRLFLGSTAAKILRELPVPMVVVPRTAPQNQEGEQR
jgi:nucleotide-binding universal stress UspA family protein